MNHGIDTGFLVAAEVLEHVNHQSARAKLTEIVAAGDGFVMALVNRYKTMTSDIVILDTQDWEKPVAEIKLPVRLRAGLHGNWVDARDLKKWNTNGVVKTENQLN